MKQKIVFGQNSLDAFNKMKENPKPNALTLTPEQEAELRLRLEEIGRVYDAISCAQCVTPQDLRTVVTV